MYPITTEPANGLSDTAAQKTRADTADTLLIKLDNRLETDGFCHKMG